MIELGNPPPNPPDVWKATGIATGDFTTRSPARSPARSSTAACPGKIPPFGAETTVVNPALRQVSMRLSLRLTSSAALRHGVEAGRSSGPRALSCEPRGPLSLLAGGAAGIPTSVNESNKPGYTFNPLPSMTHASGGMATSFPTAVMRPREMTMVAFSTGGPETGMTLAPRMAKYCGSPPCARRDGAAQKRAKSAVTQTADAHLRIRFERMQDSSRES